MKALQVRFFHWIGCQRVCACHPSRFPVWFFRSLCVHCPPAADDVQRAVIPGELIGCPSVCRQSLVRHHRNRLADLLRRRGAAVADCAAGRSRDRTSARVRLRRVHRSRARRGRHSAIQRPDLQRPSARGERSARARRSRSKRPSSRRTSGAAPRRLRSSPAILIWRTAPRRCVGRAGSVAQPQFRSRRQASARRTESQEEGRRAPARSHSAQGNRPLLHTRRRLAGRGPAGHRRFRDEQA